MDRKWVSKWMSYDQWENRDIRRNFMPEEWFETAASKKRGHPQIVEYLGILHSFIPRILSIWAVSFCVFSSYFNFTPRIIGIHQISFQSSSWNQAQIQHILSIHYISFPILSIYIKYNSASYRRKLNFSLRIQLTHAKKHWIFRMKLFFSQLLSGVASK